MGRKRKLKGKYQTFDPKEVGSVQDRLQKLKKGTPNYKMGYRWHDILTGREYTIHPSGFEGVKVRVDKNGNVHEL